MTLLVQIAAVLVLMTICCFAPGFFVVRHRHWSPMEKLCGSVGLSIVMLYLLTWENYWLGSDGGTIYLFAALLSTVLGIIARKDILALVRCSRVRQTLLGYAGLMAWTLIMLGVIRVYSGAGWNGDWLDHFERTEFFLHHLPVGILTLGMWAIPARPPLMDVVAVFFLSQTRDRFELFQVIFSFLNLLMLLPCCLIMPALGGKRQRSVLPLTLLFALSPVVMQTTTYTWTRGLTSFFVISGFAFYLAAWRKRDPIRMTVGFVSMSAGILTHYSAGPYAVFLALHYLVIVLRHRENKVRELAVTAAACAFLLATWFGWSIATYGTSVTFGSNFSVTAPMAYQGSNAGRIALNIYHSFAPAFLRDPSSFHFFDQGSRAGLIRDNIFVSYEGNVIFSMGLAGGLIVVGLFWQSLRRRTGAEGWFWRAMIPFCVLVGIAVEGGGPDIFGLAHVTLLSLAVLGLAMLAGALPLRKMAMAFLLAGCLVDFSMGILLQLRVESAESTESLSRFAQGNQLQKEGSSVVFLGDHFQQ